jgi:hypothetical protein
MEQTRALLNIAQEKVLFLAHSADPVTNDHGPIIAGLRAAQQQYGGPSPVAKESLCIMRYAYSMLQALTPQPVLKGRGERQG